MKKERYLSINIVFVIKCSKHLTKEFFVLPANSSLAGTLITIGNVADIFTIICGIRHYLEVKNEADALNPLDNSDRR